MSELSARIRSEYSHGVSEGELLPVTGYDIREINPLSDFESRDLLGRLREVGKEPDGGELSRMVTSMFISSVRERREAQRLRELRRAQQQGEKR